jgi:hypothetical protein
MKAAMNMFNTLISLARKLAIRMEVAAGRSS